MEEGRGSESRDGGGASHGSPLPPLIHPLSAPPPSPSPGFKRPAPLSAYQVPLPPPQASGVFVALGGLPFILSLSEARVAALRRAGFEVLAALLTGKADAAAAPGAPVPPEWLLSDATLAGLCGYLAAEAPAGCDAARLLLRLTRAAARRQTMWESLRPAAGARRGGLRRLLLLIQACGCDPPARQESQRGGGESADASGPAREPGAGAGGSLSGKREARRGVLLETLYCLMGAGGNSSAQVSGPGLAGGGDRVPAADVGSRATIRWVAEPMPVVVRNGGLIASPGVGPHCLHLSIRAPPPPPPMPPFLVHQCDTRSRPRRARAARSRWRPAP